MHSQSELDQLRRLAGQGRWPQARVEAQRLLVVDQENAEVWFLLGAAEHALGARSAAMAAFHRVLELSPANTVALNALASVLAEDGRLAEAAAVLDRLIARAPTDAASWFNRGVLADQMADPVHAIADYERALDLEPGFVSARMNRGVSLMLCGRYREAVDNNRELVKLQPGSADAYFNLAEALLGLGDSQEALRACDEALAIDPGHAKALIDRGLALSDLGRIAEAGEAFEAAEQFAPGAMRDYINRIAPGGSNQERRFDPELVFLYRGYERLTHCDWALRERYINGVVDLVRTADNLPRRFIDLPLAYQVLSVPVPPDIPFDVSSALGARYAAAVAETGVHFAFQNARQRLRVGYLSPDFREHLNAYLTLPLFRNRDRNGFEVFAYSLRPDDGSAIRNQIRQAADRMIDLSPMSDLDAARQINSDGIDILIDLGGYTRYSRPGIAAFRPSPLQVSYLGFPGTIGAAWMDYRIADRISTPPAQQRYWTEQLVYLPDTFFIYDYSTQSRQVAVSRSEYGIPEDAFVFACFNNFYKIAPEIFGIWMQILAAVPSGLLWLAGRDRAAVDNLRREAEVRGISGARIMFAPFEARPRYLARFRLADLFLDTPVFNAMTTACDSLAAGVPILTTAGEAFPSRVAASLLSAAGFTEGIAPSLDAYRALAIDWGNNPERLRKLRRARLSEPWLTALFDNVSRARQLEAAYREMWHRYRLDLPPASFEVSRMPSPAAWRRWH